MPVNHNGDIVASEGSPEWIAFGDAESPRMLVVSHHEDDQSPDHFYPMQKKMCLVGR